jgi:DNA-directed RNA polymerase subunit M/transcription elongation factor TFIIS
LKLETGNWFIIPTTMDIINPAEAWRELAERYRRMSDEEILNLARQISELTDFARQALTSELSHRGLKPPPAEAPAAPRPEPPPDSPYAEDCELADLCKVWSRADAQQVQTLLDRAGIPFYMGEEKAVRADAVTSSFPNGVAVQVMSVGLPYAYRALQEYQPADEPVHGAEDECCSCEEHCPKCHSTEVIFQELLPGAPSAKDSSPKFQWLCDECGHQWEDDGIVQD